MYDSVDKFAYRVAGCKLQHKDWVKNNINWYIYFLEGDWVLVNVKENGTKTRFCLSSYSEDSNFVWILTELFKDVWREYRKPKIVYTHTFKGKIINKLQNAKDKVTVETVLNWLEFAHSTNYIGFEDVKTVTDIKFVE